MVFVGLHIIAVSMACAQFGNMVHSTLPKVYLHIHKTAMVSYILWLKSAIRVSDEPKLNSRAGQAIPPKFWEDPKTDISVL